MTSTDDAYAAFCAQAQMAGLSRRLRARTASASPEFDFSHNDYLGFARHPQLIAAARRAAVRYGVGATGSRLLSGDSLLTHALERRIARMKHAPRALVFSSGYALNATVATALLDRSVLGSEPAVFCDRLVHASLYHAFAAAGVKVRRYHHQDLDHLESLLRASQTPTCARFIFTESIFGMDGDRAPIAELRSLAATYNAMLYIDEAHATGLFGIDGTGLASVVARDGGIVMGTFSKALGGSGGYVACNEAIYDYLIQRCGGFIYSTAAAPPTVAAALRAWQLLPHCDALRQNVLQRAARVRTAMKQLGFNIGASSTHLIPAIFRDVATAERARDHLARNGIAVSLVRPPTVPPNAARIRIAVCATHDDRAINTLLDALRTLV